MPGDASSTYLIRHGRTEYSSRYLVNGLPERGVLLDADGVAATADLAVTAPWLSTVRSARVSGFPRTRQTAELLLAPGVPIDADTRLDEIHYGRFEGGPWLDYGDWLSGAGSTAVPPGGVESWCAAVTRMLSGLIDCLQLPGPRLVVAHGLLCSVVMRLLERTELDGPFLPEAACLAPVALTDDQVRELAGRGREQLSALTRRGTTAVTR